MFCKYNKLYYFCIKINAYRYDNKNQHYDKRLFHLQM